jgi:actin-related protein 3
MKSIILDLGSLNSKIGYSFSENPSFIDRTLVTKIIDPEKNEKEFYYGEEACKKRFKKGIKTYQPIKNGIIDNFDYLEKFWNNIFYEILKIDPSNSNVLLSTSPQLDNKHLIPQIMFETFQTERLLLENNTKLSLISSGKYKGLILDSGHEITSVVPYFNNINLTNFQKTDRNFVGKKLTECIYNVFSF